MLNNHVISKERDHCKEYVAIMDILDEDYESGIVYDFFTKKKIKSIRKKPIAIIIYAENKIVAKDKLANIIGSNQNNGKIKLGKTSLVRRIDSLELLESFYLNSNVDEDEIFSGIYREPDFEKFKIMDTIKAINNHIDSLPNICSSDQGFDIRVMKDDNVFFAPYLICIGDVFLSMNLTLYEVDKVLQNIYSNEEYDFEIPMHYENSIFSKNIETKEENNEDVKSIRDEKMESLLDILTKRDDYIITEIFRDEGFGNFTVALFEVDGKEYSFGFSDNLILTTYEINEDIYSELIKKILNYMQ